VVRLARQLRRPLCVVFALVICAKLQHCAWEEAVEFRQFLAIAVHLQAHGTAPVEALKHDCDNESGCLCRGATLAQIVDLGSVHPVTSDLWHFADADASPGFLANGNTAEQGFLIDPCPPPPLSGRILRAHLSSLVI
jgi:hypothetical protein